MAVPYFPTEVEKLTETKAKKFNSDLKMTSAQLVGPKEERKGSEVKNNIKQIETSYVQYRH
jgi:hypothetical protein